LLADEKNPAFGLEGEGVGFHSTNETLRHDALKAWATHEKIGGEDQTLISEPQNAPFLLAF
jgi:hypothetical protein